MGSYKGLLVTLQKRDDALKAIIEALWAEVSKLRVTLQHVEYGTRSDHCPNTCEGGHTKADGLC